MSQWGGLISPMGNSAFPQRFQHRGEHNVLRPSTGRQGFSVPFRPKETGSRVCTVLGATLRPRARRNHAMLWLGWSDDSGMNPNGIGYRVCTALPIIV